VKEQAFRLGFDIGGTFTDFVLVNEQSGETFLNKCLTTPSNPAEGVLQGLGPLLDRAGIRGQDVSIAIHATTLVTNALIERKGARTALLTTEGFRDVLEMGTEVRYDIYDLFLKRPAPLVPRHLRFGIKERLWRDGTVLTPLDQKDVERVASELAANGVESVAICFLHSFRDDAHEQSVRETVRRIVPDATISISAEVAPEIREYERMSTTVANAYVQPILNRYIDEIEDRLRDTGYQRRLFLMLSSGGTTTGDAARRFPIRMTESGPAAGVLASAYLSRSVGVDSFVSFDMGGTTAKIGLVSEGQPSMAGMMEVARVHRFKKGSGIPIKIPVIELIEIGAGGGSIAHIDSLGLLNVGPRSAGADPGPACYGLGGNQPTVTDANLLLGYFSAENFLGGEMVLDRDAAVRAVSDQLATPLGLTVAEAARGVYEIVNQNMLSAAKVHVAERGGDPRRLYLFAFGGAGPAHAYELTRLLGMRGFIVPPGAGATSALGLVVTAPSFEFARSYVTRLDRASWDDLLAIFTALESEGYQVLREAGVDDIENDVEVVRSLDLRHKGQGHELNVTVPNEVFAEGSTEALAKLFYERYQEKYGHALTHLPVELITCRCTVRGPEPAVPLRGMGQGQVANARKGTRPVCFVEVGNFVDTPVYDRYGLSAGTEFDGPAIVEERECTVVVGPSGKVRVDHSGHLVVDLVSAD
jgi:N-methylhydantoinase A